MTILVGKMQLDCPQARRVFMLPAIAPVDQRDKS
jgi:hypothetical protein